MDDVDSYFIVLIEAKEGAVDCFYRALTIGLYEDIEFLDAAFLNLLEQVIK